MLKKWWEKCMRHGLGKGIRHDRKIVAWEKIREDELNGGCVLELKTTLVIRKTREDEVNP
jgi:hypothetical protein